MNINREIKDLVKKSNTLSPLREQSNFCDIKVSIFVLCYNHEKYIKNFIESALNQLVDFGVEIIINDDCSTDESARIITEYHGKYPNIIIPILQSKNYYKNDRKKIYIDLFNKSSGKYIAFCEGDDSFADPLKLYLQTHLMEKHGECNFASHFVNKIDIRSNNLISLIPSRKITSNIYNDSFIFELFSKYQHPQTSSYFIKKSVFPFFLENLSKLSGIVTFDDMSILLLSAFNSKSLFINRVMSNYSCFVKNGWMETIRKYDSEQLIKYYASLIIYYKTIDDICDHIHTKHINEIINDRLLDLLYLKGQYKNILQNKTLRKLLWKNNKKRYVLLKLIVNHPKLYSRIKRK